MSRLFSRTLRSAAFSLALSLSLGFSGAAVAGDAVTEAREAADLFRKSDSSLGPFFRDSAGYAVFPSVVKGGLGLGGAGGSGTVFQRAAPARTGVRPCSPGGPRPVSSPEPSPLARQ